VFLIGAELNAILAHAKARRRALGADI
jgi:hypothetical protein